MSLSPGKYITPFVITYNEETNIGRTLESLRWAERVVVLDSGSTDATESIARGFPNVDWRTRAFDSFKGQCEYGIHSTGIETEYVLALDADMALSAETVEEITHCFLTQQFDGGVFGFRYCIIGQPLAGSLYPAQIRLFRRSLVQVEQVGHGHRFAVPGSLYQFSSLLIHDDRKPLERWVAAQLSYSALELKRISDRQQLRWRDRLRRLGVMPWLIGLYAYCKAGGPFRGAAAARYAYERATFECLLALRWFTERLERQGKTED